MTPRCAVIVAWALCIGLGITTSAKATAKKSTAAKPAQKRSRTLQGVIALAMREGKAEKLPLGLGRHVGYSAAMPSKVLDYPDKFAENGFQKSLFVTLDSGDPSKPLDLVLIASKKTGQDGKVSVKSRTYRASLQGELTAGVRADGSAGKIEFTDFGPGNAVEAEKFKSDLDYFLTKAIAYEFRK